jgi:hypothetical protein
MRQCAEAGKAVKGQEKDEKGMPMFWRVFGGTLLSIGALVVMTLYQGLNAGVAELRTEMDHLDKEFRKDLARLSEVQGDLIRKGDFDATVRVTWTGVRELQEDRKALTALKERCAALVELFKAGEAQRRKLTEELHQLRRHKVADEERRQLAAELARLCERLAQLEGRHARRASVRPASGKVEEGP